MVIIGSKFVDYESLYVIKDKSDIKNTPPNSIVLASFLNKKIKEIFNFCQLNTIKLGVRVERVSHAIYSNANKATFILADRQICSIIQKIADNYMFDAKICIELENENDIEIENLANLGVDGIIFKHAIKEYGSY